MLRTLECYPLLALPNAGTRWGMRMGLRAASSLMRQGHNPNPRDIFIPSIYLAPQKLFL